MMTWLDDWILQRFDALVAWLWAEMDAPYSMQYTFVAEACALTHILMGVFYTPESLIKPIVAMVATVLILSARLGAPHELVRAQRQTSFSVFMRLSFLVWNLADAVRALYQHAWLAAFQWALLTFALYYFFAVPPKRKPPRREKEESGVLIPGAKCA